MEATFLAFLGHEKSGPPRQKNRGHPKKVPQHAKKVRPALKNPPLFFATDFS
jgi:hypothetical protein